MQNNSEIAGLSQYHLAEYKRIRNIQTLYPWQQQFLNDHRLVQGQNALLTAQTGGGKTLIAEILILRQILRKNCGAILVLPFVALVQEKILALQSLAEQFGFRIEEYAASKGRIPPIKRQDNKSLFVCTIEKASLLINSLIEKNEIQYIGLLVIDEVHMIGEPTRGATLETLIVKYAAAVENQAHQTFRGQIFGMSATIGNVDQLALFLHAFHYHNSIRPIELKQYVVYGKTINQYKNDDKSLTPVRKLQSTDSSDPDGVIELALEIVPKHSVLIFCPSRQTCENLCQLFSNKVSQELKSNKNQERGKIVDELKAETDNQAAQALKNGIRIGVAYHHAGLMTCERQAVEAAFHSGAVSIVCATSTLAVGVNLPARRVIIRSPKIGNTLLTKSQFLQMAGRAGRVGFDDIGECYIIAVNEDCEKVIKIVSEEPIPNCYSQLSGNLGAFILDLIGDGFTSLPKLKNILRYTLFSIQKEQIESVDELLMEALNYLVKNEFLTQPSQYEFGLTFYGRGKFHSGLTLQEIPILVKHFLHHFELGIPFKTRFSIIYICIPFDIKVTPDWDVYRQQYLKLEESDQKMFGGEKRDVENIIFQHQRDKTSPSETEMRLFAALLINRLCKYGMTCIYDCSKNFKLEVGWIQQTYDNMCYRVQALGRFSEHVNVMWPLKGLLPDLVNYMRSAGNEDIAQLMVIDGMTRSMAFSLNKTKANTVGAISRLTIPQLSEILNGKVRIKLAEKIIFNAKCVMVDAIDEMKEEIALLGGQLSLI